MQASRQLTTFGLHPLCSAAGHAQNARPFARQPVREAFAEQQHIARQHIMTVSSLQFLFRAVPAHFW